MHCWVCLQHQMLQRPAQLSRLAHTILYDCANLPLHVHVVGASTMGYQSHPTHQPTPTPLGSMIGPPLEAANDMS